MNKPLPLAHRPDVFTRKALDSTFSLLRQDFAPLALEIQNILANDKLHFHQDMRPSSITDHFHVVLDPQIVGKIIEALTQLGHTALTPDNPLTQQLASIRQLIKRWMQMAEWIIMQAEMDFQAMGKSQVH